MKSTDIRRLKRARDLYGKIAEILEKVTIDDLAPASTRTFIDLMKENAMADKSYLESLIYSANRVAMAIDYANSEGASKPENRKNTDGFYTMHEWSNGMEDFEDAEDKS